MQLKGKIAAENILRNKTLNWALRRDTSGSMRLLQDECTALQLSLSELNAQVHCDSERASMAAINTGLAEITCGSECAAQEYNLQFLPLSSVNLDLVTMRKTYFRTLLQSFLDSFRSAQSLEDIKALHGYKLLDDFQLLTTE